MEEWVKKMALKTQTCPNCGGALNGKECCVDCEWNNETGMEPVKRMEFPDTL